MEKKKKWLIGTVIFTILIAAIVVFIIKNQKSDAQPQSKIKTVSVSKGSIQSRVHALGTVDSSQIKFFKAGTAETINEINVSLGKAVKKDEDLVTFLDQNLQNDIEEAKANVEMAAIDAASAGRQLEHGDVTKNPDLQDKADKANIELQQARDKLNLLLSNEKVPPLKAPFDGTVVAVSAQNGDEVQKGDPLLEIADLTKLKMNLEVDELDISQIKPGQHVQINLNALPGTSINGMVDSISSIGEIKNGVSTFSVTVLLTAGTGVKPGMTGEAYILTSEKDNILTLPMEAVQEKNGHQFVMVKSLSGKQEMVKIKTGIHDDQLVEIVLGLEDGENVIIPKTYSIDKGKKQKKNGSLQKMFGGKKGGKQK